MIESRNVTKRQSSRAVRGAGLILWKGGPWIVAGYLLYKGIDYSIGSTLVNNLKDP